MACVLKSLTLALSVVFESVDWHKVKVAFKFNRI